MTNPNPAAPLAQASLGQAAIVPKAAEQVWAAVPEGTSDTGAVASLAVVEPTQVRRPWRSTARSVFQFAVALATLLPFIATGVYGDDLAQAPVIVGQVLLVAGAITRVMALPQVETFLRTFLPFLSAAPKETHP